MTFCYVSPLFLKIYSLATLRYSFWTLINRPWASKRKEKKTGERGGDTMYSGCWRNVSGEEHSLLFQRTHVQIPTPVSGGSQTLQLQRTCTQVAHIHTHTNKNHFETVKEPRKNIMYLILMLKRRRKRRRRRNNNHGGWGMCTQLSFNSSCDFFSVYFI